MLQKDFVDMVFFKLQSIKLILIMIPYYYILKRTDKWLNNANPWILSAFRCNHDFKLIAISNKDSKSMIYYIINYITKTSIYTSHMYFLL
jgi:hypothetical protein